MAAEARGALDSRNDVAVFELPTIRDMNPLARRWIYRGIRSRIMSEWARERTVTLHLDKAYFNARIGVVNEKDIYVFLVNKEGASTGGTGAHGAEKKSRV